MKSVRRTFLAATALTLGMVLAACGEDDSRDVANLDGNWVLVEFDQIDVPADPEVETTLNLEDGRATGNTGINNFTGTYDATENGKVTFSSLEVTEMAGSENATQQEQRFLAELEKVENFEYDTDDDQLELNDGSDDTLLVFSKAD